MNNNSNINTSPSTIDPLSEFKQKLTMLTNLHSEQSLIQIPNLYITASTGCRISEKIQELVSLLMKNHLFQFSGEETLIEWEYINTPQGLSDLYSRIHEAAGFYGTFHGLVVLYFDKSITAESIWHLIHFAKSQQSAMLFVFIIPHDIPNIEQYNIKAFNTTHLSLETVNWNVPSSEELAHFMKQQLINTGYTMNNDTYNTLVHHIRKITSANSFWGYDTIEHLINDILWNKSISSQPSSTISQTDIQTVISNHILLTRKEERPQRHIGFAERN